jgi:hypothetical protein
MTGTAWTDHIRDFAKRKGLSYGCALSDPECSTEYHAKRPPKLNKKEQKEAENMGAEDVNVVKKKGKKAKKKKLLIIEDDLERAEREQMGSEDINRAGLEPLRVKKVRINGKIYLVDSVTRTKFFDLETQNPIEDPRKAAAKPKSKAAAKPKSNSDTETAEQISIEIMMNVPKPNVTYTAKEKFEELANLDKIEEMIKNSLELKRITKKEAAALRGKKSLGFVRDLITKMNSTPAVEEDGGYSLDAQLILQKIMMNVPKPNVTYTVVWKKQAFEDLNHIYGELLQALKMKRITRKEYGELRDKADAVGVLVSNAVKWSGGGLDPVPVAEKKPRGRPKTKDNIQMVIKEKVARGRPKKYATEEEAKAAKSAKSIESNKRRAAQAKQEKMEGGKLAENQFDIEQRNPLIKKARKARETAARATEAADGAADGAAAGQTVLAIQNPANIPFFPFPQMGGNGLAVTPSGGRIYPLTMGHISILLKQCPH